jgi:hypothetical protein
MLKCNVDVTCYTEQNMFCVGVCLRDEHGRFVLAYAKRFEGRPVEIRESEAMGVLENLGYKFLT